MRAQRGFRAGCRGQAGLAFAMMGRYFTKPRHVALNLGCLIFAPFITLFVWTIQAMFMLMIGIPLLAYALLMMAMGGGVTRPASAPVVVRDNAAAPMPPEFGSRVLVTPDHKWMSYDGVHYMHYAPPPAPPPP